MPNLDEPRHQVIGRIDEKTWSAFIIYRNDKIRMPSGPPYVPTKKPGCLQVQALSAARFDERHERRRGPQRAS